MAEEKKEEEVKKETFDDLFDFEDDPEPFREDTDKKEEPPSSEGKTEREKELEAENRRLKQEVANRDRREKVTATLKDVSDKFPHANMDRLKDLARKGASAETIFDKAREQEYAVRKYVASTKADATKVVAEQTAAKEKELEESYGKVHGAGEGAAINVADAINAAKSEAEVMEIIRKSGK